MTLLIVATLTVNHTVNYYIPSVVNFLNVYLLGLAFALPRLRSNVIYWLFGMLLLALLTDYGRGCMVQLNFEL